MNQTIIKNANYRWIYSILILGFLSLIIFACHEGHGLNPTGEDATGSSGISGTITFVGEWPDSTLRVNLIALKNYPKNIDPNLLFSFISNEYLQGNIIFGDTITEFIPQYDYTFNLNPDLYEWIIVAWFPTSDNLFDIKELGAYYGESEDFPEPVYVSPGELVENIDIVADFINIKNDLPFFKQ